jgi:hypothetical protein
MIKRCIGRLLAALAACVAIAASAHQFHAGITDVSFNDRTGSIEVVHTYMTHDVEALLANLYQRPFDLGQPEDEAVFRKYVEKQFYLLGAGKARLPLRWIGLTVDTESVVVYQEVEKTPLAAISRIHHDVMSDFLADQANTVNIKQAGAVRSLTFDARHTESDLR